MSNKLYNDWSLVERVAFRYSFIFFSLLVLLLNPVLPMPGFLDSLIDKAVMWMANGVFSLNYIPPSYHNGGSGDTLYHYVLLLSIFLISLGGCVIWSLLDRSKKQYPISYYWLTVMIRYYLALTLINYGLFKITKVQFASPDLMRLIEPYGDSSPMGLAWTFLGFSDGYNLFMGVSELLAVLLFFRRTVTIGALICVAVCSNIVAINYFFDVPVKILSTMLLMMSLFLLVPNLQQLSRFFFKSEAVKLRVIERPLMSRRWLNASIRYIKYLIILVILCSLYLILEQSKVYGDGAPKLPLYGVYKVESFETQHSITKWEKLVVQRSDYSAVSLQGNNIKFCNMTIDTVKHQLSIAFKDDPKELHWFAYSITDPNHLGLKGNYFGQEVKIQLTKQHFELMDRSFNWVSEEPYNR